MMLKTLILDDDLLARKALTRLVEKRADLELVAVCESGDEALRVLEDKDVDVVLLDVEMPGMTGFEFLDRLSIQPCVILITSKEDYAFNAFNYQVFTYLKKPVTIPNFNQAVDRLIERRNSMFKQSVKQTDALDHVYLKVDNRLVRVKFDEILFVENVGDYVKVVCREERLVVHVTMKSLMDKLPADEFMRVHRSYIVNLHHIRDIEQNALLIGEVMIPVSRSSKPELMQKLNVL